MNFVKTMNSVVKLTDLVAKGVKYTANTIKLQKHLIFIWLNETVFMATSA